MNRPSTSIADGNASPSSNSNQNRIASSRCSDVRATPRHPQRTDPRRAVPRIARCTGDASAKCNPFSNTSSTLETSSSEYADSPGFPEKNLNALTSRGCAASESWAAPNSGVGVETGNAVGDAGGDCTDGVGVGVETTADTAGGAAVGDALCTGMVVDSRV